MWDGLVGYLQGAVLRAPDGANNVLENFIIRSDISFAEMKLFLKNEILSKVGIGDRAGCSAAAAPHVADLMQNGKSQKFE